MTRGRTPPENTEAARLEIAAFNRSFWCRCSREARRDKRRCPCRSPATTEDVRLLLEQGYG